MAVSGNTLTMFHWGPDREMKYVKGNER